MIVRPLAQDFDWDQYVDVTVRAFGPVDEALWAVAASNSTVAGF